MQDGFVRIAAVSPRVRVGDVQYNVNACIHAIRDAAKAGAKIIVLPELCVTGSTCGDLFWQEALLTAAEDGVSSIASGTADCDALVFVGAPVRARQVIFDCAIALSHARILGVVPKQRLDAAATRHFTPGPIEVTQIRFAGSVAVPFGVNQRFACVEMPSLAVTTVLGDDLPTPVSLTTHATVVTHLNAKPVLVGSAEAARQVAWAYSSGHTCAYAMANAGLGESTTDNVFAGQSIVAQNGKLLVESAPFASGAATATVDVQMLISERRRRALLEEEMDPHPIINEFDLRVENTKLTQAVDPFPFIPSNAVDRASRCEEILDIQACGLAERMRSIGCEKAVVGISGGLDSTLALLVTARAFDMLGLKRVGITAITMPGFGTTDRTHNNAWQLTRALGAKPREIPIAAAVRQHFSDIGHNESVHNAAYENSQARERTQILMDVANDIGAIVVGTGDLSELALGWATYNGDHMSMYSVNASIPKTLVRYIVRHVADTCGNKRESRILLDVFDTPVSPELLPANADGTIAQQTEDLVGPYELHDFFVFHLIRHGFSPRKIYRLACAAFDGAYSDETILKWLKVFYRRFFAQQFKRSCSPDGPAVGSVSLSPRGGSVMPSDASGALWQAELERL